MLRVGGVRSLEQRIVRAEIVAFAPFRQASHDIVTCVTQISLRQETPWLTVDPWLIVLKTKAGRLPGLRSLRDVELLRAYLQAGSPSPAVGTSVLLVFTAISQLLPVTCVWVVPAVQKPAPTTTDGVQTPVDGR